MEYLETTCHGGIVNGKGEFVSAFVQLPEHDKMVRVENFKAPERENIAGCSVFLPGEIRDGKFVFADGILPDNPEIKGVPTNLHACFVVSEEDCAGLCWEQSDSVPHRRYGLTNWELKERMASIFDCDTSAITEEQVKDLAYEIAMKPEDDAFIVEAIESANIEPPAPKQEPEKKHKPRGMRM